MNQFVHNSTKQERNKPNMIRTTLILLASAVVAFALPDNGNTPNITLIGGVFMPQPPAGWKIVAVGDYNGDNYPDLVLQNTSTNQAAVWYLQPQPNP